MTDEESKTLDQLRAKGYAIAVFTPEELGSVDPGSVEDAMVETGWRAIEARS